MTSDALITAVTSEPTDRPSSLSASTVIEATRRVPFASSSTLEIASPLLMAVTRAGIWFRALSRMAVTPWCQLLLGQWCCDHTVPAGAPPGAIRWCGRLGDAGGGGFGLVGPHELDRDGA